MARYNMVVLGAGPHGRQLAALINSDPNREYDPVLCDDNLPDLRSLEAAYQVSLTYAIGAAWPKVRRQIFEKAITLPMWTPYWSDDNVIFPGVQLGWGVELGEHVQVLYNAVISHGCQIGDFTTICAGAVLAGDVTVEHSVFIGANAVIRHGGITIGRNAVVGMGAVVVDDVPDNTKVVGNPAKVLATL